jgi:hypothetical protein
MKQLTEIIYQRRLKHVIDKRLHKIESLEQIFEYLQNRGIMEDTGPHGYLLIQDVWDYFPRYDRRFGFRLRSGVGVSFISSRTQGSEDRGRHITNSYFSIVDPNEEQVIESDDAFLLQSTYMENEKRETYVALTAEYHRPINVRWQVDFDGEARYKYNAYSNNIRQQIIYSYGHLTSDQRRDEYCNYQASSSVILEARARYIYNSRTEAGFEALYDYRHYNSAIKTHLVDRRVAVDIIYPLDRYDLSEGRLILGGFLTYRISIPTTLRANIQYEVYRKDVWEAGLTENDRDNYILYFTLSHHIY